MLEEIQSKLKEIDDYVSYGRANLPRDITVWDYIVFNRTKIRTNENKTSRSYHFDVHIVRENFVPEGMEDKVISKMQEIPGVKVTNDDFQYDYTTKPKTNTVVEMLTISFAKAVKA